MKTISQKTDDRLLEYIDGTLSPADREKLEQEISSSEKLSARLEELQTLVVSIKNVQLEHPSKNFTQRVMDHLDQYPLPSGLSIKNSIFLLVGVMIAVGIGTFLLASGIFDTTSSINLNELGLPTKYIETPLPSIPFNGKLVVNIIILLNIALALIVLDRAILKPWFERRSQMHF